jgi:hypothetical protein
MPKVCKGDIIKFSYDPVANLLRFKINEIYEGALKRIFTDSHRHLVPCFVMINEDDEILIEA